MAASDEPIDPALVTVGGQVASGKSTLARALADQLGARYIETDRVCAELAGANERFLHEAHWMRLFTAGFEEEVYAEMLRRAGEALAAGEAVVVEAAFARAGRRGDARALARLRGVPFLFVECRAAEAVLRERIAERDRRASGDPEEGWQVIHDDVAARWEPVPALDDAHHIVVRTDRPTGEAVVSIEARLRAGDLEPGRASTSPRPEVVTFDCWNTLVFEEDWTTAHALRVSALRDVAAEAGTDASVESAAVAFDAAWERHMRIWREGGATGAHEVALWALAELGLRDPHPAMEHLVRTFEEASHSGRVRGLRGARETLEALATDGVRCALVCDTGLTPGRVVRHHLDRLGLLDGLAVQIFSDEIGVPKPAARTFLAALEALGVPPERALHVGDLRRTDVAGARAVGMDTVRIRDRYDDTSDLPDADFVVDSHAELRELIASAR